MKKLLISAFSAVTAAAMISMSASAGTWIQDTGRTANMSGVTNWWWQNNDGTYPKGGWFWIDGDGNGIAESYYFDADGYMLASTTTPDNYTVDNTGAWTKNGTRQVYPNQWVPGGNVLTADSAKNVAESAINPVKNDYDESSLTHSALTDEQAYAKLMEVQRDYPDGTPWDDYEMYVSGNRYGYGCAAFVFMVQERLYGTPIKPRVDYTCDISKFRVGDHLRLDNNTHSVIVLTNGGDYITVAEGNYNDAVHWGRRITAEELKKEFAYRETCY